MKGRISQQLFWAFGGGIALTCAFDGIGLGFCAWFALSLIFLSLRDATVMEGFRLGLLAGFVHFVTLLYWLVPTMHLYGPLPLLVSIGFLLLLAFYLAIYVGLFSALMVSIRNRPGWLVLTIPVAWVSFEYQRTHLFTGFPWGLIGYSQYRYLPLIQLADIFGVYGISFFLCLINAAVLLVILYLSGARWQGRPVDGRTAAAALLGAVLVFAFVLGYGKWRVAGIDRETAASGAIRISVVQGNIEQSVKWEDALAESTAEKYIHLSEQIASVNPDLIVWPETALPFYLFRDKELTAKVLPAIDRIDTHFLVGSPSFDYDRLTGQLWLYNSAYMIDPDARPIGKYDKVHLVPFGEYVPLRKWLPFVGKMVPQIGDFGPGEAGHLLSMKGIDIGVQICYEVIFPELSAEMVRNGGDLLVNITNDAWFGRTAAPWQHFSMALFRAVENRRPLIRAANTGISAFVDTAGRIQEYTPLFESAVLTRDVPAPAGSQTFYTRNSMLLPAGCLVVMLLLIARVGVNLWRRRRDSKFA